MRWLRIAYTLSRAGRPILLSATLLGGCGGKGLGPPDAPLAADARDAQVIIIPMTNYDAVYLDDARLVPGTTVDGGATLPSGCLDIDAGADAGLSLPGGQAARVTMAWAADGEAGLGRVTLAAEIAGLVIGLPEVEMVDRHPSNAATATVSNVRPDGDGFLFDVAWTGARPGSLCMSGVQQDWTFRTIVRLRCGGSERAVESLTTVALCGNYEWASSGDACDQCAAVCEMAPSPLQAANPGDDLPLGCGLGVVVRPLAKVGGAVVLLAEHAPRDGLAYAWRATAGTLEELAPDVVLWRPPAGSAEPQLAQVAVTGDDLATVASFRWDRRAA